MFANPSSSVVAGGGRFGRTRTPHPCPSASKSHCLSRGAEGAEALPSTLNYYGRAIPGPSIYRGAIWWWGDTAWTVEYSHPSLETDRAERMAVLRTDIEKALDELVSQEVGMRVQGLAVVLGKKRWPELIARQRKKDLGLDAYAPSSLTPDRIGRGLAASITPTLKKISADAKSAKENSADLSALLFVTPARVGNADRKH